MLSCYWIQRKTRIKSAFEWTVTKSTFSIPLVDQGRSAESVVSRNLLFSNTVFLYVLDECQPFSQTILICCFFFIYNHVYLFTVLAKCTASPALFQVQRYTIILRQKEERTSFSKPRIPFTAKSFLKFFCAFYMYTLGLSYITLSPGLEKENFYFDTPVFIQTVYCNETVRPFSQELPQSTSCALVRDWGNDPESSPEKQSRIFFSFLGLVTM